MLAQVSHHAGNVDVWEAVPLPPHVRYVSNLQALRVLQRTGEDLDSINKSQKRGISGISKLKRLRLEAILDRSDWTIACLK